MTVDFQLALQRDERPGEPPWRFETQGTVSAGATEDGRFTAVLLGVAGHEPAARQLAWRLSRDGGNPTWPEIGMGCLWLDRGLGRVRLWAPPIGPRQLFWSAEGSRLGVATRPENTLADPSAARLRPEALFQYVYFHMLPGPGSIYAGVSKLAGGHRLDWAGATSAVTRWWRPHFEDTATVGEPEAAAELRRVLQSAVAAALPEGVPAGAFLSGGLDSSTVAGLAAGLRPGIPTVSMGFDAQGYDEMEYARTAARHFGTTPLEYYVTPEDVLGTLPDIAATFPEPFGNSSAAAAYHCARIAREHGLSLLLAGDGGDELFGGNERYAKQLVFERYERVPRLLRTALLEPAVSLAARITGRFPIGKAKSYIAQARVPLPDRLQTYNFLHRHAPEEIFSADLLAEVDRSEPLRALREEYGLPSTSSAVNRMLFLDWKFTLHDNDLVKVSHMCQLGGVDVAYPMLDPAVVEFSQRIPGDWKVRNGELRWFYKRAMQGFLPDEIIHKTKHGFGLPFGVWTRTHAGLRALAEDALESLAGRGWFRPAFLRETLRLHREGHAAYYGELVWIFATLELWYRSHHRLGDSQDEPR